MRHSESFTVITKALLLAKSQISILPLVKDAQGDKAKYIRLGTLLAAIEPVLLAHDLMIVQGCSNNIEDGLLIALRVETTLLHVSGEWISTEVVIPVQGAQRAAKDVKPGEASFLAPTAQAGGVSLTYGRRYGIFAVLSIAVDEDTDGAEKTQSRRARARGVAVDVATRTDDRLTAMRDKLNKDKVICACGAKQGEPHKPGCTNGEKADPA